MAITKIQTVTVGSGGSSTIDFSSIPSTYTDLLLVSNTRDNNNVNGFAVCNANLTVNGSSNFGTARLLLGQGSGSAASGSYSNIPSWHPTSIATANTFSNTTFYISNYTGSNSKPISINGTTENNATFVYQFMLAGLWTSSSTINRLTLTAEGLFAQYSSATLYGITKGSSGGVTVS